jgi:hypothetical protein
MEWLGGLLLGALVGYLLEFTRPLVISLFIKGKHSLRDRRAESLLREYRRIQRFKKDNFRLIVHMLRYIMVLILLIIATIIAVGSWVLDVRQILIDPSLGQSFYWMGYVFLFVITIMLSYVIFYIKGVLSKFYHYKEYRQRTIAKLRKLTNMANIDVILDAPNTE